jgi:hypothetical protein
MLTKGKVECITCGNSLYDFLKFSVCPQLLEGKNFIKELSVFGLIHEELGSHHSILSTIS